MREWMSEPTDTRPVVGECVECGGTIHDSDYDHYGDVYYLMDGDLVCEECILDYCNKHYRKGD